MADKTWLFVPTKEKFLKSFEKIEADYVILDLEDSLKEEQKEDGLTLAGDILQRYGKTRSIYVRVNSGERMEKELHSLQRYDFAGFMIPKFENVDILKKFHDYIGEKEIIALIETTKGVIELPQIAASPLVHKLAFGAEDYCRELGFEAGEEATYFPRNQMVLYGAYNQKYVLDGVCLDVHNMEVFKEALNNLHCPICYNGDLYTSEQMNQFTTQWPQVETVMIGRGILKNPGLIGEITEDTSMSNETLLLFHNDVLEGYKEHIQGDINVLYKMKEWWCYLGESLQDDKSTAKSLKKLMKCKSLKEYEALAQQLIREK